MRLFPRLLLSFFAVVLVGVLVVSVLANQAAAREVHGFMIGSGMTTESGLAQRLAGYYRGRGSWQGVESVLGGPGHGMMRQRFILVDAQGRVIADTEGMLTGQTLDRYDADFAVPVESDGERIATVITEGGMSMAGPGGFPENALLGRVNTAIWLAAGAAGAAALVVGGLIAYGLVRPIRQLTQAADAIARGDLSQRVPVTARDEIGDLAHAFNAMAADLEKAERLRRDMTADIAHELRNPLAVLQSHLEAVIDGVLQPTPDNLEPLLDQARLLSRIVDDLRTLALADAGGLSLDRAPCDPAALARSVITRFTAQAEAKGITLRTEVPDGLPPLNIDSQRIEQVLGNLLSNAIRHTPQGGSVVCRVTRDGAGAPGHSSGVTFSVTDTGPGIMPDALPHVFDRFYRADKSRSRTPDGGGTGLGLAIARQLVLLHGGEINVESEPGQGTAVLFTLPV